MPPQIRKLLFFNREVWGLFYLDLGQTLTKITAELLRFGEKPSELIEFRQLTEAAVKIDPKGLDRREQNVKAGKRPRLILVKIDPKGLDRRELNCNSGFDLFILVTSQN